PKHRSSTETGKEHPPSSAVPPIVVAPGAAVSFGQQGGITAGQVVVNNPPSPERTWQAPDSKWDEWVQKLNEQGSAKVSIGAFISNNDGMRVVEVLAGCFQRSNWNASRALLPANPDGVVVGASEMGPKLETIEWGLRHLGLRVTSRDIRPAYNDEFSIVIG